MALSRVGKLKSYSFYSSYFHLKQRCQPSWKTNLRFSIIQKKNNFQRTYIPFHFFRWKEFQRRLCTGRESHKYFSDLIISNPILHFYLQRTPLKQTCTQFSPRTLELPFFTKLEATFRTNLVCFVINQATLGLTISSKYLTIIQKDGVYYSQQQEGKI